MIDICIPAHVSPEILCRCLDAYEKNTEVKRRYIIFNDGAGGELTSAALAWAADNSKADVTILRSKARTYFTDAMNECLKHVKYKFHAVVDPRFAVVQRGWEGLMLHPLMVDHSSIATFSIPHAAWSKNPPSMIHKRDGGNGLKKGLFMLSRWKSATTERSRVDPAQDILDEAYRKGKRVWVVPSVRLLWEGDSIDQEEAPGVKVRNPNVELILSR